MIEISITLTLIIVIYIIYIKSRILQDKKEIARKELEHQHRLEIENKVIDSIMAIMRDRVIFAQKIMASEGTNNLIISEYIKDIIADEAMSFLKNLEPDVNESLRSLYADEARMKKMLIESGKKAQLHQYPQFFLIKIPQIQQLKQEPNQALG